MNRREFLAGAGRPQRASPGAPDFSGTAIFHALWLETYFNAAAQHPLGLHAVAGMQRYMDFMSLGWTDGLHDFWEEGFLKVKPMYARLINAKPSEIALTGSTTIGENTLLNGMNLQGGNVVTNDLWPFRIHFRLSDAAETVRPGRAGRQEPRLECRARRHGPRG